MKLDDAGSSAATHAPAARAIGASAVEVAHDLHHHHAKQPSPRRHQVAVRMAVIFSVLTVAAALAAVVPPARGGSLLWLLAIWPSVTYAVFAVSYLRPHMRLAVILLSKNASSGTWLITVPSHQTRLPGACRVRAAKGVRCTHPRDPSPVSVCVCGPVGTPWQA